MDFQAYVDMVGMPCCVMSVEKREGGSYGDIRIVCSNQVYKEVMGPKYHDGMLYYDLVPKDNKFEDYCYRAAVLGQRMHAYVETKALHTWTDQTLIPLASDREDLGYCQFIFEFTESLDAGRMADISVSAAEIIIEACMTLLSSSDFRASLKDVLKVVLKEASAVAVTILLIDHKREEIINYCEALDAGFPHLHEEGEAFLPYEMIRTWEDMIGVSNNLIIQNNRDMEMVEEKNPAWAQSMKENGVYNLVMVPLRRGRDIVGYMYVVNYDVSKVVEIKEIVELLSFILGSEIYNYMLYKELEELSRIDTLTGIFNRRAMKNCLQQLEEMEEKPSVGIVSIDLNGLKTVNDADGHEAGDNLLIRAAELLKGVFRQDDLFRTGGDEFIVISIGIGEENFRRRMKMLHDLEKEQEDVRFAVGGYWTDGSEDLKTAIRKSDDNMYAEKKAFYAEHPELMRK